MKELSTRVGGLLAAVALSGALTLATAVPTAATAEAGYRRPMGGGFHGGGFHGGGFHGGFRGGRGFAGGRGFRGGFGGFDGGYGGAGLALGILGTVGTIAAIAATQAEAQPVCGYARQVVLRPNGTYYRRTVRTCE